MMLGTLWIPFSLQHSKNPSSFSDLTFFININLQEMFGKYSTGQFTPFVGQFIPTGTLDTTNARRNIRGPPEQYSPNLYVNPRDVYYDSHPIQPLTRESNGSQRLDPYASYAYSDYNSTKTHERRHQTTGSSTPRADHRSYIPEHDLEYDYDDDGGADENYYSPPTRQERAYDRSLYSDGPSTANLSPQGSRRDNAMRRCQYVDPWKGTQCSKYTLGGQEKRRHWMSVHEHTELMAMTNGSLPEGEGNAITSVAELRHVREKLACPKCGQIFTRHDAQKRHMVAFRH